jgi:hypothetical protein
MPDSIQPPAVGDAPIPPVTAPVVTAATLTDDGYLDSVLQRLRSLTDKAAIKEGKDKGNSIFENFGTCMWSSEA